MTPSPIKVAVTGSAGFLGKAVVQRLGEVPGILVVALDRKRLDLAVPGASEIFISEVRPDVVLHLAASMKRSDDPEARAAQWRDTFLAGQMLIAACAAGGVKHFLCAGSVEELGNHGGVLAPSLPPQPLTTYGLCKSLLLEVARFHARKSPLRVDWFRPFTVYGPGQRGTMMIPTALRSARLGIPADFTDGLQERDFVFSGDLVEWLVQAVQARPSADGLVHVHHLGGGQPTRVRDVLLAIQKEFPKADFRLGALPRRATEPAQQIAPPPSETATGIDAFRPRVPWQEGVVQTAAWWRQLPEDSI